MSKFLRTAAEVVGVVVAIAAAIPTGGSSLFAGPTLLAGILGTSAATASLIAVGTEVAVAAFEALTAPKPKTVANPMAWQSDPQAALPIIIGRAYSGGKIVYRNTWGGDDLPQETLITCYSIGPVKGMPDYYVNGVLTAIIGTDAQIPNNGKMQVSFQLGAQPEATQLGALGPPDWTTASKLSGLSASSITLTYDAKGSKTLTTEPQCGFVIEGVRVYDPRKDDTYPGGAGPQRSNDETTWSYAGYDNPGLAALAWLIGWRQNGKLVAGVGMPVGAIIVEQLVELANVCDANDWKVGGELESTDNKYQRYKDILQAAGAVPLHLGAQIGCLISTPRVSVATIEEADVGGDASVQTTQGMRDRINAVVPRYMAEQSIVTADPDHPSDPTKDITSVTWGIVAAGPVIVDDYVTFDGGQRQKQIDYPLVQGVTTGTNAPNQVAQLARYDIENAREFGPISLPLKLRWMGYKPGDVVTANLPELGLNGQDILIVSRELSPQDMVVTMTARSETAAKHAFALGQTTTAPATPSVSLQPAPLTPVSGSWTLAGGTVSSGAGSTPALIVALDPSSAVPDTVEAVIIEFRTDVTGQADDAGWSAPAIYAPTITSMTIGTVAAGVAYDVAVSYRSRGMVGDRLIIGPETAGDLVAGAATKLAAPRTIAATGDINYSVSFDGSSNVTSGGTLATVNANVGTFGSASAVPVITVNAKGLVTAVGAAALGTAAVQNIGTSGANVPLLNANLTWSGTQSFGSGARATTVATTGQITTRYDDNSAAGVGVAGQNFAITGTNQGFTAIQVTLGAGGVSGAMAFRQQVLALDTWASSSNRTAQWSIDGITAGTLANWLKLDGLSGLFMYGQRVVDINGLHINRPMTRTAILALSGPSTGAAAYCSNPSSGSARPYWYSGSGWADASGAAL